jgi:YesN/AraC family two-component response regulator
MFDAILIVDDHEAVRLENCFPVRPEWRICGEAADGIQDVEKAKALRPTIVLVAVSMPGMDALELTRIRGVQPIQVAGSVQPAQLIPDENSDCRRQ